MTKEIHDQISACRGISVDLQLSLKENLVGLLLQASLSRDGRTVISNTPKATC
jgi:hypothetical protein